MSQGPGSNFGRTEVPVPALSAGQTVLEKLSALHDDVDVLAIVREHSRVDGRIPFDDEKVCISSRGNHANLALHHHHLSVDARRRNQGVYCVFDFGAQGEFLALVGMEFEA